MKNGFRHCRHAKCWLEKHWFNWAKLCPVIINLPSTPVEPSPNPSSLSPSYRHSYKGRTIREVRLQAWMKSVFSFCQFCEKSSAVCWLPKGKLPLGEQAFLREQQTFCLKFGTKKELYLLRARGCKQYKNQKLIWYLTFLSLLVKWELDFIFTFAKCPDLLMKSFYGGSCGADSLSDPLGQLLSGRSELLISAYFFPFCFMCTTK